MIGRASGSSDRCGGGADRADFGLAGRVQVIVRLDAPGLAQAVEKSRTLSSASKQRRLDLRAAPSRAYLAELDAAHARFERALAAAVPSARVRWNYRIVLNALAVVVP